MAESLDNLINAIQHAVIEAQEIAEDHHIDLVSRFFEEGEDGKTRAITQEVWVPDVSPGANKDIKVDVPLMALASLGAMKIKELKVEFEAQLSSLDTDDEEDAPTTVKPDPKVGFAKKMRRRRGRKMALDFKRGSKGAKDSTIAKISISFEGTDPPEGVIRLNNQILKTIP